MKRFDLVLLTVYLVIMIGATVALFAARRNTLGDSEERLTREYRIWVAEARRQSEGDGPVKRRVPKSAKPPRVILLRDYFGVCLTAIWVLGSGTLGTIFFLLRGVLQRKSPDGKEVATADPSMPDPE